MNESVHVHMYGENVLSVVYIYKSLFTFINYTKHSYVYMSILRVWYNTKPKKIKWKLCQEDWKRKNMDIRYFIHTEKNVRKSWTCEWEKFEYNIFPFFHFDFHFTTSFVKLTPSESSMNLASHVVIFLIVHAFRVSQHFPIEFTWLDQQYKCGNWASRWCQSNFPNRVNFLRIEVVTSTYISTASKGCSALHSATPDQASKHSKLISYGMVNL